MRDVKYAVRTLLRTPMLSAVAVTSLAFGIGANASIYSIFEQMLLRPLPVAEPDRLVNFEVPGPHPGSDSCGRAGGCDEVLSYPMLRDLERYESSTLAGVAGHVSFGVTVGTEDRTVGGTGLQVTGSYFPLLGVRPALGRLLSERDDETVGVHRVAVLSHRFWMNDLGGDPAVLNSTLTVNGEPLTVVGVSEPGFNGTTLGIDVDVFVPLTLRAAMLPWFDGWENRRWYWAYAFARLAPGATIEQARQEMNGVYNGIINEVDVPIQTGLSESEMAAFRAKELVIVPGARGQSTMHEEVDAPLLFLFMTTALVLLIACANVANLLLARGLARGPELSLRTAIGAGRGQLLRQLLTESLVLAATGGLASLIVARWLMATLPRILPPSTSDALTPELRPEVLLFTAAIALGTGFVFGLYPALVASRADLGQSLKSGARTAGEGAVGRLRSALVTGQITLSVVLLVGAALFLQSLSNVARVDLGLDTGGVVGFSVNPAQNGYSGEEATNLFIGIEQRLATVPGVTDVTATLVPVLAGDSWGNDVSVEGFEWSPGVDSNSRYTAVGPGYFAAMRTSLLAGREFTPSDALGAPKVAIINETFAHKFGLDPRNAVGKFMARGKGVDELDMKIVGVIQETKYSDVKAPTPPLFIAPYRQLDDLGGIYFYARTSLDPDELVAAVPDLVREFDSDLLASRVRTLDDTIRAEISLDRLISMLSTAFALLATSLAAIGLYGALSYTVVRRTREIGIRMALGAGVLNVRRMIMTQVGRMLLVGATIGMVASFVGVRWTTSLLYGLERPDAKIVLGVVVVIGAVAALAGYLPANRAARVEPVVALRQE